MPKQIDNENGGEQPQLPNAMSRSELPRLVEAAGFIFRGRVVRHGTTDANLMAASGGKIVTVVIEEILRSTDTLSGLTGQEAIVVTEYEAALEDGTTAMFFTNVVVVADHLVVREVGHLESSLDAVREIPQMIKDAEERPLQQRVVGADLIVTGNVVGSRPVEKRSLPRSEHDPDWWIARVQVQSVHKGEVAKGGKAGQEIQVLFANSTDIAWYKAPKLHEGMSGVLILRYLRSKDSPPEVGRPIYQAIDPLDFLPTERLPEVQRYLVQRIE